MKKVNILIYTILITILISGCSNRNENLPFPNVSETIIPTNSPIATKNFNSETPSAESPSPQVPITIFHAVSSRSSYTENDLIDWERYIYDKYKKDLDVVFIPKGSGPGLNINEIENSGKSGGLVYCESFSLLNELIDSGLILSVNEILASVDFYSVMEKNIILQYVDMNGKAWALPLSDTIRYLYKPRYYDKGILDMLTIDTPTTIDDLYYLALSLKEINDISDYESHIYLSDFKMASILNDFEDVFKAFGCVPYYGMAIAYNPIKSVFENCILNEGFVEAVAFIKMLYDDGLIIDITNPPNGNTGGNAGNGSYTTVSTTTGTDGYDFNRWVLSHYISGVNTDMLIQNYTTQAYIAVLKNTQNPKQVVQDFIDLIASNKNSWLDFQCGIEGESYSETPDCFYNKTIVVDGKTTTKNLSIQVKFESLGFNSKPLLPDTISFDAFNEHKLWAKENIEEASAINDNVVYTVPLEIYDNRVLQGGFQLQPLIIEMFNNILNENVSIEDAIEQYTLGIKKLGIYELVDTLNQGLSD